MSFTDLFIHRPVLASVVSLLILVVGSILFHFLSPWYFTPIASNWGAMDATVNLTFVVTGFVFIAVSGFGSGSRVRWEKALRSISRCPGHRSDR